MNSIRSKAPLRETTLWADYRDARKIPHRYGVCGGEALQYDSSRRTFVWADHPCLAVDSVLIGGQKTTAFAVRTAPDSTGHAVTFIDLATPAPESSSVVARGRGKLHPFRGGLMENPSEVLWDVLANLGGMLLPESRLDAFRQQSAGLIVGGSVESDDQLFSIARSICDSIGAVCSPDMPGFAQLWPGFDPPAIAEVLVNSAISIKSSAIIEDVCDDLTIRYAFEAGQPRGAVQYRVGRRTPTNPAVMDAPWISSARVAALVCARLLGFRSRSQWEVEVTGIPGQIRPGQVIDIQHPACPVSGPHMALARTFYATPTGDRSQVTVRAPKGVAQPLVLIGNKNAADPLPVSVAAATVTPDELSVTVVDDATGQRLPGAQCELDGSVTRTADSAGVVTFPARFATPGEHRIVATLSGRPPVIIQFNID